MARQGQLIDASRLPGVVAHQCSEAVGLATYRVERGRCEVVTINAIAERAGVGRALIKAVTDIAAEQGCSCVVAFTTNDNTDALAFYQRVGFRLSALFPGAVETSRRLKPAIPHVGLHGIAIRDEILLELDVGKRHENSSTAP